MKPLLVLAGGFGTRLKSVVSDRPKPLAPIGDQPFLALLLENWVTQGVNDFVFLLHHGADQIVELLDELQFTTLHDAQISVVVEHQPLGTGGAIAYAITEQGMQGSLLVANADTWLGTGLVKMAEHPPCSIAAVQVADTSRYGGLQVSENGLIHAFTEKRSGLGAGLINGGIYHLRTRDFMSWNGHPFSLEQDLFPRLVNERRLLAVQIDSDFIDIGVPEDYYRFKEWMLNGRVGTL